MNDFVVLPRKNAAEISHKYYYGGPCKTHGHGVARYTSDKSCVICRHEKSPITKKALINQKENEKRYFENPDEKWLPVNIEEYSDDYQVSNQGRVWSNLRYVLGGRGGYRAVGGKLLVASDDGDGYLSVGLTYNGKSKTMRIHRLVSMTFNGAPPEDIDNPQVNHKDGNKLNNKPENLEWVTTQENTAHSVENGLWDKRNISASNVKLSWEDIDYIRSNYKYKCPKNNAVRLGEKFGVNSSNIYNIVNGSTWDEVYRDV